MRRKNLCVVIEEVHMDMAVEAVAAAFLAVKQIVIIIAILLLWILAMALGVVVDPQTVTVTVTATATVLAHNSLLSVTALVMVVIADAVAKKF